MQKLLPVQFSLFPPTLFVAVASEHLRIAGGISSDLDVPNGIIPKHEASHIPHGHWPIVVCLIRQAVGFFNTPLYMAVDGECESEDSVTDMGPG
ncbi:unnamed protein product [Heligmosomoides polygyrus]|uniref:Secreted protein n=1 Tax=Heligmosomoides polygyrus TaxID=6339 RepID=A0A183FSF5_HELPZ|nr:unnamed protein product [Heligmosomoides polygyrus]